MEKGSSYSMLPFSKKIWIFSPKQKEDRKVQGYFS